MGRKLSDEDYWKIKKVILRKLHQNRAYRKGHLLFERLQSGIEPHLKGFVKEIICDLLKEELIVFYGKTHHGDAFQLNIKKIEEIKKLTRIADEGYK